MDFEREVIRHKDAVYRQMVRVCGNEDDAEDVLVEALIKAFKASDSLEDPEAFRNWLTIIGKRVCFRLKQQQKKRDSLSLEALEAAGLPVPTTAGPTADEQFDLKVMHECVMTAFESMPEHYKAVYRLREIEGRSALEAAKELKITVPNVKARLHRARKMIRQSLDLSL